MTKTEIWMPNNLVTISARPSMRDLVAIENECIKLKRPDASVSKEIAVVLITCQAIKQAMQTDTGERDAE